MNTYWGTDTVEEYPSRGGSKFQVQVILFLNPCNQNDVQFQTTCPKPDAFLIRRLV